jgi:hypothetical protein
VKCRGMKSRDWWEKRFRKRNKKEAGNKEGVTV